jgi:adenylyltransferase/sulfurtransferase
VNPTKLRPNPERPVIEKLIDYQEFCGVGGTAPGQEEAGAVESISVGELKTLLDEYKASTKLKAQKRDDEKVDCLGDAGTIAPSDQVHTLAQTGDWALKC